MVWSNPIHFSPGCIFRSIILLKGKPQKRECTFFFFYQILAMHRSTVSSLFFHNFHLRTYWGLSICIFCKYSTFVSVILDLFYGLVHDVHRLMQATQCVFGWDSLTDYVIALRSVLFGFRDSVCGRQIEEQFRCIFRSLLIQWFFASPSKLAPCSGEQG